MIYSGNTHLLRCNHGLVQGCSNDNTTKWCEDCPDNKKHCLRKKNIFKHKRAACSCKK